VVRVDEVGLVPGCACEAYRLESMVIRGKDEVRGQKVVQLV
jgi:hypothetical protein